MPKIGVGEVPLPAKLPRERRPPTVAIISMPWASLESPSIQLGTLKPLLNAAGFNVIAKHFYLDFMDFLAALQAAGRVSLDRRDYHDISYRYWPFGMGDWLFSFAPLRSPADGGDPYLEMLSARNAPQKLIERLPVVKRAIPEFIDERAREIVSLRPDIVGFSTSFSQNTSSLMLALAVKNALPATQIVFGGANCDGPMGSALHRAFPWIDVVFRGPAEDSIAAVFEDLVQQRAPEGHPGLCYRVDGRQVVNETLRETPVDMDTVPCPDYDEYFERLATS
jgi:hypothetical protein